MRPGLYRVGRCGALWAANGRTKEDLRALNLAPGDLLTVQIIRSRNAKLCALAHTVIGKIADGVGVPAETIKTKLKEALGYYDLVQLADGTVQRAPRSMRFEEMVDEDDFIEFWRACEVIFCDKLLPEFEAEERAEILNIMAGRPR